MAAYAEITNGVKLPIFKTPAFFPVNSYFDSLLPSLEMNIKLLVTVCSDNIIFLLYA